MASLNFKYGKGRQEGHIQVSVSCFEEISHDTSNDYKVSKQKTNSIQ